MTDDVTTRLAAIEQRANAATTGPWDADVADGISQHWSLPEPWQDVITMAGRDSHTGCTHVLRYRDADAEFIAHAREDVPWLIEQLRSTAKTLSYMAAAAEKVGSAHTAAEDALARVREMHKPFTIDGGQHCHACNDSWEPWPCPTIRALDGEVSP